ncbi:MAG: phage tail protein [Planctomycetota bacterium]|nr:MAG: phage tail protein [Planctomycetota bacterium]
MGRVAGIIRFKANGTQHRAKGNFSYNIGAPKREAVVGADAVHGYKETPQQPFIEGEITDSEDLKLKDLVTLADGTITLELANGKLIALYEAWFAGDGTGQTQEANIAVRYEGMRAEEVA